MTIGSESSTLSRRATPRCVTFLSAGRRSCRPTFWRAASRTSVYPSQTSRSWRIRIDSIQPTTTSSYSCVTRHCGQQVLTNPTRGASCLPAKRRASSHLRSPAHAPLDHASLSLDGLLSPWHYAHVAHAGAFSLVDWHEWCTRWWLRHCLK